MYGGPDARRWFLLNFIAAVGRCRRLVSDQRL